MEMNSSPSRHGVKPYCSLEQLTVDGHPNRKGLIAQRLLHVHKRLRYWPQVQRQQDPNDANHTQQLDQRHASLSMSGIDHTTNWTVLPWNRHAGWIHLDFGFDRAWPDSDSGYDWL